MILPGELVHSHFEQFLLAFCTTTAVYTTVALRVGRQHLSDTMRYICFNSLVIAVFLLYCIHYDQVLAQRTFETLDRHDIGPVVELNETSRIAQRLPFRCPNGTGYVFDQRSTLRPFIGCAPLGHRGCSQTNSLQLEGSCPDTEACCFWGGKYRGCAPTLDQCCYDQICPLGYTCCGNERNHRCCPLPLGQTETNRTELAFVCSDRTRGNPCLPSTGAVQCPVSIDNATCTARETLAACAPPTLQCQSAGDCRYGNQSLMAPFINRTSDAPDLFYESVPYAPVACCPNGGQMCFSLQRKLIGCADPTRNETCCGDRVCPAGYQCCTYRIPKKSPLEDAGNPAEYDVLVQNRCCPLDVDCCEHPRDNASVDESNVFVAGQVFDGARSTFCGLEVQRLNETTQCAVDAMARPVHAFFYQFVNRA